MGPTPTERYRHHLFEQNGVAGPRTYNPEVIFRPVQIKLRLTRELTVCQWVLWSPTILIIVTCVVWSEKACISDYDHEKFHPMHCLFFHGCCMCDYGQIEKIFVSFPSHTMYKEKNEWIVLELERKEVK